MKLGLFGNYDVSVFMNQSPGKTGKWNTLEVIPDAPDCDGLLVCNRPEHDLLVSCYPGNTWLAVQEPPYEKNNYFQSYFKFFNHVISHVNVPTSNIHLHREPALLPWHVGMCYDDLMSLNSPALLHKTNTIAWVTSNSNMNPGHKPRLDFLDTLKNTALPVELYGRGIRPIKTKADALLPAKYAVAVENFSDTDYWTEKIADCFLAWCLPVYYGCTNLNQYFPEGSFIWIDINKPAEALVTIEQLIAGNEWEKRLELIKEARQLVLNKYNLFPAMEKKLSGISLSGKKKRHYIPAEPWRLKSKIKNIMYNR